MRHTARAQRHAVAVAARGAKGRIELRRERPGGIADVIQRIAVHSREQRVRPGAARRNGGVRRKRVLPYVLPRVRRRNRRARRAASRRGRGRKQRDEQRIAANPGALVEVPRRPGVCGVRGDESRVSHRGNLSCRRRRVEVSHLTEGDGEAGGFRVRSRPNGEPLFVLRNQTR